jgi:hypothetical protein
VEENSNSLPGGYDLSGTSQANVLIGAITDYPEGTKYKTYEGVIDDVRVYGYALSEGNCRYLAEVGDLWVPAVVEPLVGHYEFENNLEDSSGNEHHATANGDPGYAAGVIGQAISLDGDGDWLSVGPVGVSGAAPRTIAGWARATNLDIPSWTNVFGFTGSSGGNLHFDIVRRNYNWYAIHVYGWERDILPIDYEWHHCAASYDGTTIVWYGDGDRKGKDSSRTLNTTDNVHVGKRGDNDNYFPGDVDDVRVYNICLDWAQIRYVSGLPTNDIADTWVPGTDTTVTLEVEDPPHWGVKAMRMDYTYHGRVSRDWEDPRLDITAGNAKSMSMWHLGSPDNEPFRMRIQMLDNSGKNKWIWHPDPDVALLADWAEWNIALSEFTHDGEEVGTPLDLEWIKKMKIDLPGSNLAGGGASTMIIDDIRVYPSRCIAEYGPAADFTGDCKVYYEDLAVMLNEWTLTEDQGSIWSGAWSNSDIGDVDPNGSFTDHGDGSYTITADGADIWGNADAFHYAYQQMSGDGQMIVRVTSLDWTDGWAKAGIMMRQDLDPNSAHTIMAVTPGNGVTQQGRDVKGGGSFHYTLGGRTAPICLRLVRVGDTFTGYFYEDGVWKQRGSRVIPMTDPIYVGMAATSHSYGNATTAEFDRACISSMVDLNDDGVIDFKDYAMLVEQWLVEQLWPY